jgi:hypothetical protein
MVYWLIGLIKLRRLEARGKRIKVKGRGLESWKAWKLEA